MNVTSAVVNLNSENPDRLRAFYRDLIGLKPYSQMGEGALIAGDTPFIVDSHSALSSPAKEPARTLLNFMVEDIERDQARLEAAGVRFLGRPSPEQISFSTFVDPDGNYGQVFAMQGVPASPGMLVLMRHSADPDRLRDFLRNVVGLSDDFPHLGNPFMLGGLSMYVGPHSEVHGQSSEPERLLLNLFVDDLAAEQARLEARGVAFIRSAGHEAWGGIISTFADPDGNYLQLVEFRPG